MKNKVDWSFGNDSGETWTGEWHGCISVYESKSQNFYEFRLTKACPKEVFNADGLSFGLKDDEVYLCTDKIDDNSYYQLRQKPAKSKNPRSKLINRKNLVEELVKQVFGELPDGKISIQFLLKHCTEDVWRISDTKII